MSRGYRKDGKSSRHSDSKTMRIRNDPDSTLYRFRRSLVICIIEPALIGFTECEVHVLACYGEA